jgi:hypothetical protein
MDAMRKAAPTMLVAAMLAGLAIAAIGGALSGPVEWTPDGLFYEARSLELRGHERGDALRETFEGPLGAELRHRDPTRSGDPEWVAYNARFYERRVAVPLAAAALEPAAGERAILDISVAGYVATILALFGLLLMRFRLPVAAAVSLATIALPALSHHASFPLTDTWGLALEIGALAAGLMVLDRGPRWLPAWVACILILSFTRDTMWIPILAAAGVALHLRSRDALRLVGTGVAAVVPALLLFTVPVRELLAMMLNGIEPAPDASWGFVAEHYPGALVDFIQANGGYVRDGAWYTAAYLLGGLALLAILTRRRERDPADTFLLAGALASVAFVLALPIFSAFRLELVCLPMAAFGLAHGVELALERAARLSRHRAPLLRTDSLTTGGRPAWGEKRP